MVVGQPVINLSSRQPCEEQSNCVYNFLFTDIKVSGTNRRN